MDGSPPKHRRSILYESSEGHDWCWVLFRRVGELFKGSERLFIGEIEHSLMCLDDLKIEGHHMIEEHLIGSNPRSVSVLSVQDRLDGRGCFSHPNPLPNRHDLPQPIVHL